MAAAPDGSVTATAPGESAAAGEFESSVDPAGRVLAADRQSLRAPTQAEQLAQLRALKLDELVRARDVAIVSPVLWAGELWSALPEDQANLIQTVALWDVVLRADQDLLAELSSDGAIVPTAVPWKTTDNAVHVLTFNEAVRLAAAMSLAKQTCFGIYWQLEAAVEAAASAEAIAAITWPGA